MKTTTYLVIAATAITLGAAATVALQQRSTPVAARHTTAKAATSPKPAPAASNWNGIASARRPGRTVPAQQQQAAAPRKRDLFTEVHNPANVPVQRFTVKADRDTLLHATHGTTLHVPAGCFVNAAGQAVKGSVTVNLQEVLDPVDYVMGNMLTTYKGRTLESGGTFNITAMAHGEVLELAEGRSLAMGVPTRLKMKGMALFPGVRTANGIEWQEPAALEAPVAVGLDVQEAGAFVIAPGWDGAWSWTNGKKTNAMYWVEGFDDPKDVPTRVNKKVSEVCWADDGLWLARDSVFQFEQYSVHLVTGDSVERAAWPTMDGTPGNLVPTPGRWATGSSPAGNVNTFQVDPATNYVFQVKQLGWANIDRLYNDKRTKPVDLITRVGNADEVGDVYITMVVKSHRMFLPGYQKADGTYSFSHGDFEPMELPVGMKAVILATAYKGDQPWYAMQEITITDKQAVDLHLVPASKDELRSALEARL